MDIAEVDVLPGSPQIVPILHRQPAFRRAPQRLGEAQRHLGTDAALSTHDPVERGGGDAEILGQGTHADPEGLQINRADELAGMRGVMHRHQ